MDIFSGLEKLGLGDLGIDDIYSTPEKGAVKIKEDSTKEEQFSEADVLYEKNYVCPVCDAKFQSKTVRSGKIRVVRTDEDLKPCYATMEPLKYEPVVCVKCGYAVMARDFSMLAPTQKALVKEKITSHYVPTKYSTDMYSYDEALERYKLALLNSVVKMSKASEKAYICLKAGWMCRTYAEVLENNLGKDDKVVKIKAMEEDFLLKAYDGYLNAMAQEDFPISGMDEFTLEYLVARLAKRFKHYDVGSNLVGKLLVSKVCPSRIKDKARDLKEEILEEMKANK